MPLNETELNKLQQVAKEAGIAAHVEGCSDCAKVRRKFNNKFTPSTCAELVREVMRLREDLRILTKGRFIQS